MAPEQVRGERVDHRADFFALGAVLYEALAGRRAFEAPSRAEVISAVLRDQPASVPALLAMAWGDIAQVLGLRGPAAAASVRKRFQRLKDRLRRVAEREGLISPAAAPRSGTARSSGRPTSRRARRGTGRAAGRGAPGDRGGSSTSRGARR